MNIDEIKGQAWEIADGLTIIESDMESLSEAEQECHFNVDKVDKNIKVCCSHQSWMTKLHKSKLFLLGEVLISRSPRNKGYILEVSGVLDIRGITVRKAHSTSVGGFKKKDDTQD